VTAPVTGARADVARHELSRRLLGTGLVDDEALASSAEALTADSSLSLARLLAEHAGLDAEQARSVAVDQIADAVFSLQRWSNGEFAFAMDELDPDDLGASVPVADVVAESERRVAAWARLVEHVPAPDAVVALHPAPPGDPAASREEWSLLALVDGRRTVAELVVLSGQGEYAVVSALAGLASRGLLTIGVFAEDQLLRRHHLLAALEGTPLPEPPFRDAAPDTSSSQQSSSPSSPAPDEPPANAPSSPSDADVPSAHPPCRRQRAGQGHRCPLRAVRRAGHPRTARAVPAEPAPGARRDLPRARLAPGSRSAETPRQVTDRSTVPPPACPSRGRTASSDCSTGIPASTRACCCGSSPV
jgi:hypothetical protein